MNSFGEMSWGDNLGNSRQQSNTKDLFLRLEDGDNELRLVTAPYQYLVHKFKKEPQNPKDFGQKVLCAAHHGSCPLCAVGDKAKPRWFIGVISRKTGAYKVLDVGYAVLNQIKTLANNQKYWGDPSLYDINIIMNRKNPPQSFYTVQPIGKSPLSAEDQVIKDSADLKDLERRVTPPEPSKVMERLEKIMGGSFDLAEHYGVKKTSTSSKAQVSMDDDNEDFPSYDAQ